LVTNFDSNINTGKTYYIFILTAVVLITGFMAWQMNRLQFNYTFEDFFPNEDKELELYEGYRKAFGHDNEFVIIAPECKEGIFNEKFLLKLDSFTRDLNKLPYIKQVLSPTNLKTVSLGALIPAQSRILHPEKPYLYKEDSALIYSLPFLVGSYFPADGKSASIFITTEENLSKSKSDTLANRIELLIKRYWKEEVHYAGRIFAQNVYLENLQREFTMFISISAILVLVFLWTSFKSVPGVLIPMLVVVISTVWTLGCIRLLGKKIDIMSSMLPTMIFIAGMSDVIHYYSKYLQILPRSVNKQQAFNTVIKKVGMPTLLTLITTVVGFLSLLFSSIKPIREFGIYTSVGVCFAFLLTYTLLPAVLYFVNVKPNNSQIQDSTKMNGFMRWIFVLVIRKPAMLSLIGLFVILISGYGLSQIKQNNILLEDLSEKVKIKRDFNFFDTHYSGVRPLEIKINLTDSSKTVWDYDVLVQIHQVSNFIQQEFDPGFIISPDHLVMGINYSLGNGYNFPSQANYAEIYSLIENNKKDRNIQRLALPNGKTSHISAKIRDMGSSKVSEHMKRISEFTQQNIRSGDLQFEVTGAAHLVDRNNQTMVGNMMKGFMFSVLFISFITLVLHRNWRMIPVFLVPNLLPLIVIAAVMGYAGVELKAATSLVFSIALGIATDDTIHFISRLKLEMNAGRSLLYSFKRTFFETGKPIIVTSLILFGGFMSLTLSNFQSTFYFGLLICITMLVALLADLFILPVLLFYFYRNYDKKRGYKPTAKS